MKKIRVADLPEKERRSPSGKFHTYYKEVSVAILNQPIGSSSIRSIFQFIAFRPARRVVLTTCIPKNRSFTL
jgi:hypothetical protein